MYRHPFQLDHAPFAEEPAPEVFFAGARREEICQSLILDLLAGKPLVKLVGREGSGKSLICRVMAERLPSDYEVLVVDNPEGSFEDLLEAVCLELGANAQSLRKEEPLAVLERLLERYRDERIKVVLLIDEAEQLFLDTLEALLHLIGDRPDDAPGLNLVLSGRPGLEAKLERLSVASDRFDIHAGYVLEELTASETRQYLRFRLEAAGMRREQSEALFSEEVVATLFETARGNLRLTNHLADEVLHSASEAAARPVPLPEEEFEEPFEDEEEVVRLEERMLELYERLRANRLLLAGIGTAVAVVLVIGVLLLGGGGGSKTPVASPSGEPAASAPASSPTGPSPVVAPVPAATVATPPAGSGKPDGNQLFWERLAASASWLTGIHTGKYTILLMQVASNQAQANVAATLAEEDYARIREQLYLFRKKSNPPTVLVLHGLYDSLDAAREARNDMPVFLRKHHPYPLSVSDALKKLDR